MEKIFEAIKQNNNLILESYLKTNDINIVNEEGESLLHCAIRYNNSDAFKTLLENYINLNIQDKVGNTPLIYSIIFNKIAFFKQLVKHNANLNLANNNHENPIFIALINNKEEMVKILFQKEVDLEGENNNQENIYFSLIRSHNLDLIKMFLENKDIYLKSKNYCGNTLLHQAVLISDYKISKYLLEQGILANVVNNFKETPMFFAVRNNDLDMIYLLIQNGALLDIKNSFFETVYDIASKKTLEYLKFKDVSVGYLKYIKKYPFHCAVIRNDYIRAKQLLSKYNINKKDNYGRLAIEYAKELNYLEVYKLLHSYKNN